MYSNLFDSHLHSHHSPDGRDTVEELAEAALAAGFSGISITDHCECDMLDSFDAFEHQLCLEKEIARARVKYAGKLAVMHGIELGQIFYDMPAAEKIVELVPYDFIMLSLHRLIGWPDFYEIDFTKMSGKEIGGMLEKYFDELLRMVKWGKFDAAGHLTGPLRRIKVQGGLDIDLKPYADAIDEILKLLAHTGKGMEINMSGLRNGHGDTMPPAWVIKRFRELGGEIVTIGSDAHRKEQIGSHIKEGMQILKDAGYRHFAFFKQRTPVFLRIV